MSQHSSWDIDRTNITHTNQMTKWREDTDCKKKKNDVVRTHVIIVCKTTILIYPVPNLMKLLAFLKKVHATKI